MLSHCPELARSKLIGIIVMPNLLGVCVCCCRCMRVTSWMLTGDHPKGMMAHPMRAHKTCLHACGRSCLLLRHSTRGKTSCSLLLIQTLSQCCRWDIIIIADAGVNTLDTCQYFCLGGSGLALTAQAHCHRKRCLSTNTLAPPALLH